MIPMASAGLLTMVSVERSAALEHCARWVVVCARGKTLDQSDKFRKLAMDYVAMARATTDAASRAVLLSMAQRWYDLANGPAQDFDGFLRDFNDRQMSDKTQPVVQQQQQ